jgi:chorismate dehydratase
MDEHAPAGSGYRITLGRIDYINVAPVYAGFETGACPDWLRIISGAPSVLNRLLGKGTLDISPVSSAAYAANHDRWVLLPGISISSFGEVMSVLLVSRYPFHLLNGKTVYLTVDSSSASALLKVLLKKHRIQPLFRHIPIRSPESLPPDADAALVIGDTALKGLWKPRFAHIFDLGAMWADETGLPFVFAVWAIRKAFVQIDAGAVEDVASLLEASRRQGMQSLKQIAAKSAFRLGIETSRCEAYFNCLDYRLGQPQIDGLTAFYALLLQYGLISDPVIPSFFNSHAFRQSSDTATEMFPDLNPHSKASAVHS